MTLLELSQTYQDSAAALHGRIADLRAQARNQADPEEVLRLRCRIKELTPLWLEAKELAALTAHYYDRSYHRNEQYSL